MYADKASSEDEEEEAAAAAARAAAERNEAVKRQLKEQLTAILLEVTDKMFGACSSVSKGSEALSTSCGSPPGLPACEHQDTTASALPQAYVLAVLPETNQ